MKKFLFNSSIFFALFALLLALANFMSQPDVQGDPNDYLAAIIDKHERLKNSPVPALVFSGGSNLSYGIDSEAIAQALQLPVVNLGLHAGLGLNFMLAELKSCLREGDMAVLSIEYFLDLDGTHALQERTASFFPEASGYVKRNPLQLFFERLIYYQQRIINNVDEIRIEDDQLTRLRNEVKERNLVYSRKSFNQHGDVFTHLDLPAHKKLGSRSIFSPKRWAGIDAINSFAEFAQNKKIRVFFMYPSYAASEFASNKEVIGKLAENLAKYLRIEIVGTPADFVFDDALFYDSIYHLHKDGRQQRTRKIIELLQPVLEKK